MELRPSQSFAIEECRKSMQAGLKRPIIAGVTSFGKTIVAAHMLKSCQDKGKQGWFFCDRIQLIKQSIDKFRENGLDFGVRQSGHPLHDPTKPIQIASIQTIDAMINRHGKALPAFDMMIVDECHTQYSVIDQIMELYNNIPVIGLTATPYSKGLGAKYNNLIVPVTPGELLEQGFWCPVSYYGGKHIDTSKLRSSDPNSFRKEDVDKATDDMEDVLKGDIIKNWLMHGENSQTIAFSPKQSLSRALVQMFNDNGIYAEHIDCNTKPEERQRLFKAHDAGEFKILSCARLLNTGYDSPTTRCLIDAYPIKSVTDYVQRDGRLRRIHPSKEYGIYLDHAGNFERFGGPASDIVPSHLDDGTKTHRETDLIKPKKQKKTLECPSCKQQMVPPKCNCGFVVESKSDSANDDDQIHHDGSMLVELSGKKANRTTPKEVKERFYSELVVIGREKGYKPGWASNKYRERFDVWPNKINQVPVQEISIDTKNWITHSNIKRAKQR